MKVSLQPDPLTARLVVAALLSHCREQLVGLEMRVSRQPGSVSRRRGLP